MVFNFQMQEQQCSSYHPRVEQNTTKPLQEFNTHPKAKQNKTKPLEKFKSNQIHSCHVQRKIDYTLQNCTNVPAMRSTLQLLRPRNKLINIPLISYDITLRCHKSVPSVPLLTTTNYAEIPVGLLGLCSSPTGSKFKKNEN